MCIFFNLFCYSSQLIILTNLPVLNSFEILLCHIYDIISPPSSALAGESTPKLNLPSTTAAASSPWTPASSPWWTMGSTSPPQSPMSQWPMRWATTLARRWVTFISSRAQHPPLQHDPEADKSCVPGGEDGNYIMFARATRWGEQMCPLPTIFHICHLSGDKFNNKRFSPCSLSAINRVLTVKARGTKGCFNGKKGAALAKRVSRWLWGWSFADNIFEGTLNHHIQLIDDTFFLFRASAGPVW